MKQRFTRNVMMFRYLQTRGAWRPFCMHFGVSLLVTAMVFTLVVTLWYPSFFAELSGGLELFMIICVCDMISGPLLTLCTYSTTKTRLAKIIDFGVIGTLQLALLIYGAYILFQARPVFMVFAVDRFNVVSPVDIEKKDLQAAEITDYRQFSLTGPVYVGLRKSRTNEEMMSSLDLALQGKDIHQQPKYFIPYEKVCHELQKVLKPIKQLREKNPGRHALIADRLKGRAEDEIGYLPALSIREGVVLLDRKDCKVIDFARLEGF